MRSILEGDLVLNLWGWLGDNSAARADEQNYAEAKFSSDHAFEGAPSRARIF